MIATTFVLESLVGLQVGQERVLMHEGRAKVRVRRLSVSHEPRQDQLGPFKRWWFGPYLVEIYAW
jgi:hypothetical protein